MTRPITVAVCTRRRPDLLAGCLEQLAAALRDGDAVLVVHNDEGDDGTRRVASEAGAVYVREPTTGLDRARNRALREAAHDIVAFLDDDARPEPGWLDAIESGFDQAGVLCVSGRVLAAELDTASQRLVERCKSFDRGAGTVRFRRGHRSLFFPVRAGVMGTGANMAVLREAGLELGFDTALDAGTPSRGGGDLDFFYKVIRAGGVVAYRPDAVVHHVHRRSWDELHRLRYDYGVASGAFAWKCLVEYRDPKALPFLVYKLAFHVAEMVAGATGLRGWPARLAWAELRGTLGGPAAFRTARRLAAAAVEGPAGARA